MLQILADSLYDCIETTIKLTIKCFEKKIPNHVDFKIQDVKTKDIIIPIGESKYRRLDLNLKENPNTFIVGTTGSGKSVCTKSILTHLINNYSPKELEIYLCDFKRVELNLFAKCEHVKEFCYKLHDIKNTISHILAICDERYNLFMKYNVTNIHEYNKLNKKKLPYIVLYIEEIVMLLQDSKKEGFKNLTQLLAICRASGIYTIITTQRPSCDILPPTVKANINNRICFKVEDSNNSIIAIDEEGGELLKGKGHGILKIGSEKTEFQSYFISDNQVKEFINPYIRKEINQEKSTSKQIGFIENKKPKYNDLDFLDKL